MKQVSRIIISIIFCFIFSSTCSVAEVVIVSGHPAYPPVSWEESGGRLVGAAVEMTQIIFSELGVSVMVKNSGPWDQVQEKARTGIIDVICAAYMNSERKQYMQYTVAFLRDPVVAFVLKGREFPFACWGDLEGKKGTTNVGESYGETFDRFSKARLSMNRAPTTRENFRLLLNGKYDYFIFGMYPGLAESSTTGYDKFIAPLPNCVVSPNFHMTFSKRSSFTPLLPHVNRIIDRLTEDGTIERLVKKYQKQYKDKYRSTQ